MFDQYILKKHKRLRFRIICCDQIKKKEMGWAHNTYGGREVQRGFWWENLR